MQSPSAPKPTRKSHNQRRSNLSPCLLDEIAFTRSDIEQARADAASVA
jgi:hypothetical protein